MGIEATGDQIDQRLFWRVLGSRPVGVMVVATDAGQGPAGFLALSFAHVSAVPPKVVVSVGLNASALEPLVESQRFSANLLPAGAQEIAEAFASQQQANDRFVPDDWEEFVTGAPVFRNAAAIFDCEIRSSFDDAAAIVMIGEVKGVRISEEGGVLLANRGNYLDFTG